MLHQLLRELWRTVIHSIHVERPSYCGLQDQLCLHCCCTRSDRWLQRSDHMPWGECRRLIHLESTRAAVLHARSDKRTTGDRRCRVTYERCSRAPGESCATAWRKTHTCRRRFDTQSGSLSSEKSNQRWPQIAIKSTIITHWPLSSRVVILLAYATQLSVLSCSMFILCILQLLQYAAMSIDSACGGGGVYRPPSRSMCMLNVQ